MLEPVREHHPGQGDHALWNRLSRDQHLRLDSPERVQCASRQPFPAGIWLLLELTCNPREEGDCKYDPATPEQRRRGCNSFFGQGVAGYRGPGLGA